LVKAPQKTVTIEQNKKSAPPDSIPLAPIQKLIAERMLQSKTNKPCFYLEAKADVTELIYIRPKIRKTLGVKITTNAFYIRALALSVKEFPLMIGRLNRTDETIEIPKQINVGFAVNAPKGLVVPVIKDAHNKTLIDIATEEKSLTEAARSNKLTLKQIEAENIALSNLGVYGIDSFFGIVPPPASTILAVGNAIRTVIHKNGRYLWRKILSLTLAVDHRIINGDYASKFLASIVDKLQSPENLI